MEIDSILYIHTGFIIVSLSFKGYEICSVIQISTDYYTVYLIYFQLCLIRQNLTLHRHLQGGIVLLLDPAQHLNQGQDLVKLFKFEREAGPQDENEAVHQNVGIVRFHVILEEMLGGNTMIVGYMLQTLISTHVKKIWSNFSEDSGP